MERSDARASADAHFEQGAACDQLGLLDEATAAFRAALEADPGHAAAACNLGRMLLYAGDVDGANGYFERALELEPRNAWFYWWLVFGRSGAVDGGHVEQMELLLAEADTLPPARQVDLHFALASVHENAGRVDDAFRHMRAANTLQRAAVQYDEAARMSFFASLEELCGEAFIDALRGYGNPSSRPIFVFGMPRSGTTLVEQLLASQPSVTAGGELHVFESAVAEELMTPGMTIDELPDRVMALGDRYLRLTDPLAGDAAHLTDKLPHNFCFAPLIHVALPNARMIHVKRDPLDTCLSCYATLFPALGLSYTYDLAELGRYYAAYERLTTKWRALLPPDRFIEVQYERFVENFEVEARRLIEFCGLPWDGAPPPLHEIRRPVRTASAVQVRRPLYRDSIGRGHRFAAHLRPLIDAMNEPP